MNLSQESITELIMLGQRRQAQIEGAEKDIRNAKLTIATAQADLNQIKTELSARGAALPRG